MVDNYEPPKETSIIFLVSAAFFLFGAILLFTASGKTALIIVGLFLLAIGVLMLLFAFDIRSPNGKFTVVHSINNRVAIIKRDEAGDCKDVVFCQNCGYRIRPGETRCRFCKKRI